MIFLTQLRQLFISCILQYEVPNEGPAGGSDPIDNHVARNDVDTPENLAFKELNEELDGIDSDARLVSSYTTILGSFLERVKNGEFEGLSEEDDDFQRLLELYAVKFRELQVLSDRGQQIQHVISQNTHSLESIVDRASEGEDIGEELDAAYESYDNDIFDQKLESATVSYHRESFAGDENPEISALQNRGESVRGNIRMLVGEIDTESEEFLELHTDIQSTILAAKNAISEENISEMELEELQRYILGLEELNREVSVLFDENGELITTQETIDRQNEVEARFSELRENGTETQKEIIGDKDFIDMQLGDFQRLAIEGEYDLGVLFLGREVGSSQPAGTVYVFNDGGNIEARKLLPYIIDQNIENLVIDGIRVSRQGSEFISENRGGTVELLNGSEIVIESTTVQENTEVLEERMETMRRSMESNVNREHFESGVNRLVEQYEMEGNNDDSWLVKMIKQFANAIAQMIGEEVPFPELMQEEQALYAGYSDSDIQSMSEGGAVRFRPNGAEILQDGEFMSSLNNMCGRLGVQRDHMLVVMQAECALDHTAVNPMSGASGLIQFMPSTARGLGTSVEAIRQMSPIEQLEYVEKYFQPYKGRMSGVEDIYRAVFYPASIGKPLDWVHGSQVSMERARLVRDQNGVIARHSTRSDGLIDNAAFNRYVQHKTNSYTYTVETSGTTPTEVANNGIGEITRGITSREMEVDRNPDGSIRMTYCSKTARLNLADLGVDSPKHGSSARASFEQYSRSEIFDFPPSDSDATVADLYLDASPGKREYGHRAACFKQNGEWYVLDPYYRMGRPASERNNPIPAEDYISYMKNDKGRNIWGAAYFN